MKYLIDTHGFKEIADIIEKLVKERKRGDFKRLGNWTAGTPFIYMEFAKVKYVQYQHETDAVIKIEYCDLGGYNLAGRTVQAERISIDRVLNLLQSTLTKPVQSKVLGSA